MAKEKLTEEEFEMAFDRDDYYDAYAEYIEEHANIGNGTMLIRAIESGDYYEGFRDWMLR